MNSITLSVGSVNWRDSVEAGTHSSFITNLEVSLPVGQVSALIGASGVGKSTIMKAIANWHTGLKVENRCILNHEEASISDDDILLLPQHSEDLIFPWYSVIRNLQIATRAGKKRNDETFLCVTELAERLAFTPDDLPKRAHQLSGGMQRRLALGMALQRQPQLLLLDEPFSGLDHSLRGNLINLVSEWISNRPNSCILMSTHVIEEVSQLANLAMKFVKKESQAVLEKK